MLALNMTVKGKSDSY